MGAFGKSRFASYVSSDLSRACKLLPPYLCVILVIQTQTSDIITVFPRDWGEQLFDGEDLVSHFAIKDRAIDQEGLYFDGLETV